MRLTYCKKHKRYEGGRPPKQHKCWMCWRLYLERSLKVTTDHDPWGGPDSSEYLKGAERVGKTIVREISKGEK